MTRDPRSTLTRRAALGSAAGVVGAVATAPRALAATGPQDEPDAGTQGGRPPSSRRWRERAAAAQEGLDRYYGAPWPQLLHNAYPSSPGSDEAFHYWWLAHAVDTRIDAYERSGRRRDLEEAEEVAAAIRHRNGGSLVNDYFDDMNWYALALHRLWGHTRRRSHLDDAVALWEEIVASGWNEAYGPSVAWRREQLDYKNTPSNAPFAILSHRLFRATRDRGFLEYGDADIAWMRDTLVDPGTGFVADGINRLGDGAVDWEWAFTYCQGVWVGALVEAYRTHRDRALLDEAARTATNAVVELADDGVFRSEGQGDGGLFKGVYYRYAWQLLTELRRGRARDAVAAFVRSSTDALWASSAADGALLAGPDWREAAPSPTDLATHLSGVMALEVRAALEA